MFTTLISTAELGTALGRSDIVICDVRHDLVQPQWGESEYAKAHVPGAQFVHVDNDLSGAKTGRNGRHPLPAPEAAATLFSRLGIDATTQVVAYDQGNGMYAARLWWMLRWLGHARVWVLDGGVEAWVAAGGALTPQPVSPRAAPPYPLQAGSMPTLGADALRQVLGEARLVDARAPERFRGEVEPLDAVAGHIPGALNRLFRNNLAADGRFKPRAQLAAEFRALLGRSKPVEVVHQCGSGVTACHNLLAMEAAGLPGSQLYPGSWSEWSADPARPVAVGG